MQGVLGPRVVDRPLKDKVVFSERRGVVQVEDQPPVIEFFVGNSLGLESFKQELFLDPDARTQYPD